MATTSACDKAPILRAQQGVPIRDYFQNAELPKDLDRAQVFVSPNGPVLANCDPVPWTKVHDQEAQDFADKVKEQIDDKGYYSKSLTRYSERLSETTGYPEVEMKAMIVSKFDATHGQDPFAYLQNVRIEKGLPTSDRKVAQKQSQEPEM